VGKIICAVFRPPAPYSVFRLGLPQSGPDSEESKVVFDGRGVFWETRKFVISEWPMCFVLPCAHYSRKLRFYFTLGRCNDPAQPRREEAPKRLGQVGLEPKSKSNSIVSCGCSPCLVFLWWQMAWEGSFSGVYLHFFTKKRWSTQNVRHFEMV
jgi:hypothetical protein